MISEFKNNTNLRFKCSPVSFVENITGKSLGNVGVLAICTLISVLIIKYAFQVNFGGNVFLLILVFLLFLFIINFLGVIFASFCKNIYICALLAFAFNFTMIYPVMVDTYSPINSKVIDFVSEFSIHAYVVKAIYGIINGDVNSITSSVIILSITTVGIFGLSLITGRRSLK
jgi:ABC-type Na+ efflux pump permease subunit